MGGLVHYSLGSLIDSADFIAYIIGTARVIDEFGQQVANQNIGVTLPERGTALDAWNRGFISETELRDILSKHGYNDEYKTLFELIANPLLSQAEMIDSYLRHYVSEPEVLSNLEKHGFIKSQIDTKLKLAMRVPQLQESIFFTWFGLITDEEFKKQAFSQGYDASLAENIKEISQWIPSPVEALINARHGAFNQSMIDKWGLHNLLPPEFVPEMQKKGLSKDTALQYWAGHWSPLSNAQATKLFQRSQITESELKEIYHLNGLAQGAWDMEKEAYYRVPEYFVIEAMVANKPLSLDQIHKLVSDTGYRPDDTQLIAEAFHAKELASENNKLQNSIENQLKKGAISQSQAEQALSNIGLTNNQISMVMQRIEADIEIQSIEELLKVIRHDYVEKFITEEEAVRQMLSEGFPSKEVDYFINLWRNERKMYRKRLTEAQVGKLFKDGKMSLNTALGKWEGMGYTSEDANLLAEYYML